MASADILRVRGIERASWGLLGDGVLCPRARDIDREERINHTRCFHCISGDPGEEEKKPEKVRCSSAQACDQLDEVL